MTLHSRKSISTFKKVDQKVLPFVQYTPPLRHVVGITCAILYAFVLHAFGPGWTNLQWRYFWFVASMWNFYSGSNALQEPKTTAEHFYGGRMLPPGQRSFVQESRFWICVLLFGLFYGLAGVFPGRLSTIVIVPLGLIAKIAVAITWTSMWWNGKATRHALMMAIGDAAFAALFIVYLRQPVAFA